MSGIAKAPDWLQRALRNPTVVCDEFREQEPTDLMPGDIVVVGPFGDANASGRLLVVVDVGKGHFHGMLAITETEFATSVDAVLTPKATGLGYEVAVLTRFHGPIWSVQIRQRVGAIEIPILEELEKLSWSDEPADIALLRGQPLQPEGIDPSYPARRALSLEFDVLTEHYRRRYHDLEFPTLDANIGEIEVLKDLLPKRGWERRIAMVSTTSEFRDRFLDSYPQLSPDQQRAAQLIGEHTHKVISSTISAEVGSREDLVDFESMIDTPLQEAA
ncbi:hypothetical protein [Candidatus Poriferisocius sp.]|uniref:hypothetical protein n=1 Tax=Candidatus Poriferisocius sp. TaxID=3101276 RepID=UPI003B01E2F7